MAVDLSNDCYFNSKEKVDQVKIDSSSKSLENKTEMTKNNNLNFYESMYHFKKMFPSIDSDVIETVLRSNDGSVDRTIDQLLTMSIDNDNELSQADKNPNNHQSIRFESSLDSSSLDLPPSYESLINSNSTTCNIISNSQIYLNKTVQIPKAKVENDEKKSEIKVEELMSLNSTVSATKNKVSKENNSHLKINDKICKISSKIDKKNETSIETCSKSNLSTSTYSNILIGELDRDFLRINLTKGQVKKIVSSIKEAKRNEITAILNNKVPQKPELSFEIKKKFNILNELNNQNKVAQNDDEQKEKWMTRYEEVTKTCEKRRLQMLQDEYIAKLIQNEEFLNELRSNNDFIETLNYESNSIRINNDQKRNINSNTLKIDDYNDYFNNNNNSNMQISNAELKLKLGFMGKSSKAKLSKLAIAFVNKAKNKCNKALDQTSITCTSLFTNFNTLKNNDLPPSSTNNSYYASNNKEDLDFIKSLQSSDKKDLVKMRNDGSYSLQDAETYDLDRIKAEELNSRFDTINKNSNKYKKVYRSFKSVMNKRNSSESSSSSSSLSSSLSSNLNNSKNNNKNHNKLSKNNNCSEFDEIKNHLPVINWNTNVSQDLITFKSDYSYD